MNLFQKHTREKEYPLWGDWRVILSGKYEFIDNDDSGQLINEDGSRAIYGSSFTLSGVESIKDEIHYLDVEQEGETGYSVVASVIQNKEALTIAITFSDPLDEEWARSVIESAHRIHT